METREDPIQPNYANNLALKISTVTHYHSKTNHFFPLNNDISLQHNVYSAN